MKAFLKSTTALILSGALILPGPLAAQSGGREGKDAGQQGEQVLKKKDQERQRQGGREPDLPEQASDRARELQQMEQKAAESGREAANSADDRARLQREVDQERQQQAEQERQRQQQAERDRERERQQQAEREQDRQRQQQAEREQERQRQQQAERERERERQQQAEREQDRQRQQLAEQERDRTREQRAETAEELRWNEQRAAESGREAADNAVERDRLREELRADDERLRDAERDVVNRDAEEPRRPDAADQARRAARDAEENRRPLAAADPRNEGRMVEQRITEDNFRSSREDFRTNLRGERRAEAEDDSGLSNFEKLALFGLGAVAVGSLLNNGDEVVSNTGDRVVVERDGQYRVLKDDDVLLRQPGTDVRTYAFDDGSTRTVALREDGTQVETLRAPDGRVLRRTRILPDGREVLLFDDTQQVAAVDVRDLPQVQSQQVDVADADEMRLRRALEAELGNDVNRRFSLSQVRDISAVRALVPEIEVDTITFDTGSAAIPPAQARRLADLGIAMRDAIDDNPAEVFLIEGHTDAVGAASMNLALSDRRAETLALALTEYFDVPPENMVVQGYGESDLKVLTATAERENRRAAVRRITPLLDGTNGS